MTSDLRLPTSNFGLWTFKKGILERENLLWWCTFAFNSQGKKIESWRFYTACLSVTQNKIVDPGIHRITIDAIKHDKSDISVPAQVSDRN